MNQTTNIENMPIIFFLLENLGFTIITDYYKEFAQDNELFCQILNYTE